MLIVGLWANETNKLAACMLNNVMRCLIHM